MKTLILAGGKGTRFSEETKTKPKPLILVNEEPMLLHIINHYRHYELRDFVILGGYKYEMINDYFDEKAESISSGEYKYKDSKIRVLNTGEETMTGGRLKIALGEFKLTNFLMTYGDGIGNVNINNLISSHTKSNCLATITAVRPPARFGRLEIKDNLITSFGEKNQSKEGWINGGFFMMNSEINKYIEDEMTVLERSPFENLAEEKRLNAFKHYGFWQPIDTIREKEQLENVLKEKNEMPWI